MDGIFERLNSLATCELTDDQQSLFNELIFLRELVNGETELPPTILSLCPKVIEKICNVLGKKVLNEGFSILYRIGTLSEDGGVLLDTVNAFSSICREACRRGDWSTNEGLDAIGRIGVLGRKGKSSKQVWRRLGNLKAHLEEAQYDGEVPDNWPEYPVVDYVAEEGDNDDIHANTCLGSVACTHWFACWKKMLHFYRPRFTRLNNIQRHTNLKNTEIDAIGFKLRISSLLPLSPSEFKRVLSLLEELKVGKIPPQTTKNEKEEGDREDRETHGGWFEISDKKDVEYLVKKVKEGEEGKSNHSSSSKVDSTNEEEEKEEKKEERKEKSKAPGWGGFSHENHDESIVESGGKIKDPFKYKRKSSEKPYQKNEDRKQQQKPRGRSPLPDLSKYDRNNDYRRKTPPSPRRSPSPNYNYREKSPPHHLYHPDPKRPLSPTIDYKPRAVSPYDEEPDWKRRRRRSPTPPPAMSRPYIPHRYKNEPRRRSPSPPRSGGFGRPMNDHNNSYNNNNSSRRSPSPPPSRVPRLKEATPSDMPIEEEAETLATPSLFISNLPLDVRRDEIYDILKEFTLEGSPFSIEQVNVPRPHNGQTHAYINFNYAIESARARRALNGKFFGGRSLIMDYAKGPKSRHVWIGNIGDLNAEDIGRFVQKFGNIQQVDVKRDRREPGTGFALVLFHHAGDAIDCISQLTRQPHISEKRVVVAYGRIEFAEFLEGKGGGNEEMKSVRNEEEGRGAEEDRILKNELRYVQIRGVDGEKSLDDVCYVARWAGEHSLVGHDFNSFNGDGQADILFSNVEDAIEFKKRISFQQKHMKFRFQEADYFEPAFDLRSQLRKSKDLR